MARGRARRAGVVAVCLLGAALGCRETGSAPAEPNDAVAAAPGRVAAADIRTTDGAIAVGNLDAQIAATERIAGKRLLSVGERAGQVELLLQRGRILARVSDYEAATRIADALVAEAPAEPLGHLARAQTCAALHRFPDALAALDEAARLGAPGHAVDAVRAGVLQAVGRSDEALVLRVRLTARRPDILALGAEATLRAERGELAAAGRLFAQALASYRDVSPFPVAWIEFQQGLMWMREDDLPRARKHLAAAHRRLPQYAEATVHLAEVEAALGEVNRAVALLRPLAEVSEDSDHAGQLARILGESGREAKARI